MTPTSFGIGFGVGDMAMSAGAVPVASLADSLVTTVPTTLTADGVSTATVTVTLKGAGGGASPHSGGTVVVSAVHGSVGAVTDNTDGTYTATYTAPATGPTD